MSDWKVSAASRRAIRSILGVVRSGGRFLCTAHVRPDGDALGSALALRAMLARMGKRAHVVCEGGVARHLAFLPGAKQVGQRASDLRPPYDAVFTTDTAAIERLGEVAKALRGAAAVVNIDHHATNTRFGTINWVDPSYAATGEMVFDLVRASRVPLDLRIALPIYTAIVTDTGRFSFSNTTERTHRMAAALVRAGVRPAEVYDAIYRGRSPAELDLFARVVSSRRMGARGALAWASLSRKMMRQAGFVPAETQEYLEALKSLAGVRMALLLREEPGGRKVKVSVRTDPGVDGTRFVRRWGGGGHPRAAGATFRGTLAQAQRTVVREAERFLDGARSGNA